MSKESSLSKHPKELWILSLSELAERFAFWGVGNLLVLYLIEYYHYPNENATQIYAIFTGCAAFLPFLGGFLADRWNYQSPLFLGALVNAIGCFLIATGIHSLMVLALAIIALGYGIFTPSLVTLLGHAYKGNHSLREAGFSIYYASINVGVFLALISLGTIAKLVSWNMAFFVAGLVQTAGLIPILVYFLNHKETHREIKVERQEMKKTAEPLSKVEKSRIFVIIVFCLISIFFWTAYNQGFSSMAIFAHSYMNKKIGDLSLPEAIFMSSESFFLILLAPFLAYLYTRLQKNKKDPSAATKTGLSLIAIALCFFVMMIASAQIPNGATHGNVFWGYLVLSYFLMAVGEMLLAPIGLSMITRLAPPKFTALGVGLWYACVGFAFFNGGMLAGLIQKMGSLFSFFSIFVILTLVPAIFLIVFSKKLTKLSHLKTEVHPDITYVEK